MLIEEYAIEPEELFVTPLLVTDFFDEGQAAFFERLMVLRLENLEGIEAGTFRSGRLDHTTEG